jgi:UDP-N-acetylmuramyl tripeptide synthase
VLTSDNPRFESPQQILDDTEAGLVGGRLAKLAPARIGQAPGYAVCSDRRRAIGLAIERAAPGDTVLIAGKGHEKIQIIGDRREPFDDCAEARAALRRREGTS